MIKEFDKTVSIGRASIDELPNSSGENKSIYSSIKPIASISTLASFGKAET